MKIKGKLEGKMCFSFYNNSYNAIIITYTRKINVDKHSND